MVLVFIYDDLFCIYFTPLRRGGSPLKWENPLNNSVYYNSTY